MNWRAINDSESQTSTTQKGFRMATLATLRRLQNELLEKEEEIKRLAADPRVREDMNLERDLLALLEKYGRSLTEAVALIDPSILRKAAPAPRDPNEPEKPKRPYTRRTPPGQTTQHLYLFTNPHTGEEVKARTTMQHPLIAWKDQYGADVVKSWRVRIPEE